MKIDRALIIRRLKVPLSLEYANACAASCEKHGVPYEFIDGVEFMSSEDAMASVGAWISPAQYKQAGGRGVSKGNNNCHASHIKTWRRIIEIDKPCLLLEHDAIVRGDVRTVDLIDNAIITFGHRVNSENSYTPPRSAYTLINIRTASGGHAYAMTPKTAKWLVDDVETNGVNINVDEWINLKCGLPLYVAEPPQVVCWPRISTREWTQEDKEHRVPGSTWSFNESMTPGWRQGFRAL